MSAPVKLYYRGSGRWEAVNAYHAGLCDANYECDAPLTMVQNEGRSEQTHRHFFACVNEAWKNLPETHGMMPYAHSSEALRAHALIMTGHHHEPTVIVCSDGAKAIRTAKYLQEITDGYSLATVQGNAVTHLRPLSQSKKAMGAKKFQESKSAVLEWLTAQIGIDVTMLQQNAGRAA